MDADNRTSPDDVEGGDGDEVGGVETHASTARSEKRFVVDGPATLAAPLRPGPRRCSRLVAAVWWVGEVRNRTPSIEAAALGSGP